MSLKVKSKKLKGYSLCKHKIASVIREKRILRNDVYLVLFSIFLILLSLNLNAQSQKDFVKAGDKSITLYNDHYGASLWYKKALDIDSTVLDIVFKYAEALRGYNDYAKAESKYYYLYKKDRGRLYPMAPYWYSTMLKYNGKYYDAKKMFKRSKRFFRDRKSFYYLKVMNEIKSCDAAIVIMKDSIPVDIKNAGNSINTYNSELGGTLINDSTMVYSSLRDEKMEEDNVVLDTSSYLVRLFIGKKNGEQWLKEKRLEDRINVPDFHIANGHLNNEDTIFYFNKCSKNNHCNIYASQITNGNWGEPYEIKELNIEGFTSTQPSVVIIKGVETIFFSSNRPGGKGGMDIWFSQKQNGTFNKPANIGESINTIEDEITPFYNLIDTSLYFSSNWHYGLGGFDIFKAKHQQEQYQKPENLGYPINTSTNDFYYNIYNKTAVITSNRIGSYTKKGETCCNDIYVYEIPDTLKRIYSSLEELNRYLPVQLYFHNDQPNPRTRDTLTELNYMETYKAYTRMYNEYKREYSNGLKAGAKEDALVDIEDLFSENIDKGLSDLNQFTPLLIKELEKGKSIKLTVKGFASPLSKSDYNVNLTLRRVSSLINYLSEYENGIIMPYINGTAENGAALTFVKVPFGEYQSVKTISDDIKDQRNSVYSPAAALERKIEIIAIAVDDSSNVALDGSELEKLPLLTFKDSIIYISPGQTEKKIKIINNGQAPLKIFAATFSCKGYEMELPEGEIPTLTPIFLTLKYIGTATPTNCTVEFLTNTIPNKIKKEIVLRTNK